MRCSKVLLSAVLFIVAPQTTYSFFDLFDFWDTDFTYWEIETREMKIDALIKKLKQLHVQSKKVSIKQLKKTKTLIDEAVAFFDGAIRRNERRIFRFNKSECAEKKSDVLRQIEKAKEKKFVADQRVVTKLFELSKKMCKNVTLLLDAIEGAVVSKRVKSYSFWYTALAKYVENAQNLATQNSELLIDIVDDPQNGVSDDLKNGFKEIFTLTRGLVCYARSLSSDVSDVFGSRPIISNGPSLASFKCW